jgi:hypothetical protein
MKSYKHPKNPLVKRPWNIIRLFWWLYVALILAIFLNAMIGCASRKTLPADWSYHKHVANKHHSMKVIHIHNCNRE